MVIVCLDVGEKRIGIARTDELEVMAHAVGFIKRETDKRLLAEIKRIVIEWNAQKVVIGLPKEMSGKMGIAANKVTALGEKIRAELDGIPVEFWDERLSTKSTERALIERDVSRRKRRTMIDALAAQEILQNYLDAHRKRFCSC